MLCRDRKCRAVLTAFGKLLTAFRRKTINCISELISVQRYDKFKLILHRLSFNLLWLILAKYNK
ncbi:hypothetical protein T11_18241 [Trichinella zimbabwensis]|uniref:Uncharacterized protein n=1 Tax=Trichinella zimbabwensis TaxID=268475 RepID=A0A0V1HU58_9BILA|nr:hypothetical protein T11_18241 [Trichinella zimbabwensis]